MTPRAPIKERRGVSCGDQLGAFLTNCATNCVSKSARAAPRTAKLEAKTWKQRRTRDSSFSDGQSNQNSEEPRGAAALELIYRRAEYTDAIRSKNQAPVIDQIT